MADAEPNTGGGAGDPEHVLTPASPENETAVTPFEGLQAPRPVPAAPPEPARWLALGSVVLGGLLGGMIGYGTGDLLAGDSSSASVWAAVGGLVGGVGCAVGVGIVAALTLRAMGEWRAVHHPEADKR